MLRKVNQLSAENKLNKFRNNQTFESWKREKEYKETYYCEKCGRYKTLINKKCVYCH